MRRKKTPIRDSVTQYEREWMNIRVARERYDPKVGFLLRTLRIANYLEHALANLCRPKGLTNAEFQTLNALRRMHPEPLSAGDIMRASFLSSGSVTAMLRQLEKKKFIKRQRSQEDARRIRVALTKTGLRLIDRLALDSLIPLEKAADSLTPAEQKKTASLLSKVLLQLEEPTSPAPNPSRRAKI